MLVERGRWGITVQSNVCKKTGRPVNLGRPARLLRRMQFLIHRPGGRTGPLLAAALRAAPFSEAPGQTPVVANDQKQRDPCHERLPAPSALASNKAR